MMIDEVIKMMWKKKIKLPHYKSWRLRGRMECWASILTLTFPSTLRFASSSFVLISVTGWQHPRATEWGQKERVTWKFPTTLPGMALKWCAFPKMLQLITISLSLFTISETSNYSSNIVKRNAETLDRNVLLISDGWYSLYRCLNISIIISCQPNP